MDDNGNGNGCGMAVTAHDDVDRLERSFNRTRDDVNSLKSEVSYIRNDLTNVVSELKQLSKAFSERGKPNWSAVSLIIGTIIAGISMAATVVVLLVTPIKTAGEGNTKDIGEMALLVRQLEIQTNDSRRADENSRTDRAQLNERVKTQEALLGGEIAERKTSNAAFRVSLAEIETQFCASDVMRNLMHAADLREISRLWEKHGVRYPTDNAYYPRVCHQDGVNQGN